MSLKLLLLDVSSKRESARLGADFNSASRPNSLSLISSGGGGGGGGSRGEGERQEQINARDSKKVNDDNEDEDEDDAIAALEAELEAEALQDLGEHGQGGANKTERPTRLTMAERRVIEADPGYKRHLALRVAFIFSVNLGVATAVNIAYLETQTRDVAALKTTSFFLLAAFKFMWNAAVLPVLLTSPILAKFFGTDVDFKWRRAFAGVLLATNAFIVPCVITALQAPTCFAALNPNMHGQQPLVMASYHEQSTQTIETGFNPSSSSSSSSSFGAATCPSQGVGEVRFSNFTSDQYRSTTFSPPFLYNYQCSSTLLMLYSPVFMFAAVLSLAEHLAQDMFNAMLLLRLPLGERMEQWVLRRVPRLLLGFARRQQRRKGRANNEFASASHALDLLEMDRFWYKVMLELLVSLSFGLAAPILALAFSACLYLRAVRKHNHIVAFLKDNAFLQQHLLQHQQHEQQQHHHHQHQQQNPGSRLSQKQQQQQQQRQQAGEGERDLDLVAALSDRHIVRRELREALKEATHEAGFGEGQGRKTPLHGVRIWICVFGSVFLVLFLADVAGDNENATTALWAPIMQFVMPCVVVLFCNRMLPPSWCEGSVRAGQRVFFGPPSSQNVASFGQMLEQVGAICCGGGGSGDGSVGVGGGDVETPRSSTAAAASRATEIPRQSTFSMVNPSLFPVVSTDQRLSLSRSNAPEDDHSGGLRMNALMQPSSATLNPLRLSQAAPSQALRTSLNAPNQALRTSQSAPNQLRISQSAPSAPTQARTSSHY